MFTLKAKLREKIGKKVKTLRKQDIVPAVLYGPKIKTTLPLEINYKEFEKIFKEAGESSLVSLEIENQKGKNLVLIHDYQKDPLTEKFSHIDFYQPAMEEEITVKVPLVFEGESLAVKELGGTLVKMFHELEVKALPQNLPHEIKINIETLKSFEDNILIKDLKLPEGVKILQKPEEIVASVSPLQKVEEELAKPIEEKVEEVKVVEKEKKEEEKEMTSEPVNQ